MTGASKTSVGAANPAVRRPNHGSGTTRSRTQSCGTASYEVICTHVRSPAHGTGLEESGSRPHDYCARLLMIIRNVIRTAVLTEQNAAGHRGVTAHDRPDPTPSCRFRPLMRTVRGRCAL